MIFPGFGVRGSRDLTRKMGRDELLGTHHRNPGSCSVLYMAKNLFRYDPATTTSTTVAQWAAPGEAGSKIFPKFQTANDIFFLTTFPIS